MKKLTSIILTTIMVLGLTACSQESPSVSVSSSVSSDATQGTVQTTSAATSAGDNQTEGDKASAGDNQTEGDKASAATAKKGRILIAYFSYGENAKLPDGVDASASASIQLLNGKITGNTGLVANYIQKATGGDLFSIRTVKTYSDNYNTVINEGQAEKSKNERPEISTHIENLANYDTIFIGFPNWWYGMPMVMYSFFDEYDFSGKTIVPFCTSGGSAFSDAIGEIKKAEPNAQVLDGLHIGASSAAAAEKEVTSWVNGLSLAK